MFLKFILHVTGCLESATVRSESSWSELLCNYLDAHGEDICAMDGDNDKVYTREGTDDDWEGGLLSPPQRPPQLSQPPKQTSPEMRDLVREFRRGLKLPGVVRVRAAYRADTQMIVLIMSKVSFRDLARRAIPFPAADSVKTSNAGATHVEDSSTSLHTRIFEEIGNLQAMLKEQSSRLDVEKHANIDTKGTLDAIAAAVESAFLSVVSQRGRQVSSGLQCSIGQERPETRHVAVQCSIVGQPPAPEQSQKAFVDEDRPQDNQNDSFLCKKLHPPHPLPI